ncbi:MAG TPA: type II toxin-antitoxin system death-on-curing family toxin [Candidatus Acidoferrales bacterium]|nr:type II toxin-antitoxin system death-on-curing family toxin [Candidatus Acidoferrales bacterium]
MYLTIAEVRAIHKRQIDQYGGIHGIRDAGLLESAVFGPQIGYYNNVAEEAAALMESLANNHPFLDGNKRVAFAAPHTFLLVNGFDLAVDPVSAFEFMMRSISSGEFRFAPIFKWISERVVQA